MSGGPIQSKCGMKVDRISTLPDDVLVHILSLLPLNTAASTSILSRRWLHLWKNTPKLIFENLKLLFSIDPQKKLMYVNWVNSVLGSHKAPSLQEFAIDFKATKSNHDDVSKWLDFAFSRRVERLHFNWHCCTLFGDSLPLEEIITLPISFGIQSLKVLCLTETKTSADGIRFSLGNCPNLEQLVIDHAIITSDLELVSPSLKHLEIQPHNRNVSIRVSAPSLTYLDMDFDTREHFKSRNNLVRIELNW